LQDLHTLEHVTGVSGEIDVTVKAADVTKLPIVRWMSAYEQQLLGHYGYLETKGCAKRHAVPGAVAPRTCSRGGTQAGQGSVSSLTPAPRSTRCSPMSRPTSRRAVITPNHREATLAFGIRLMPLSKQKQVIDYMGSPPASASGASRRSSPGWPVARGAGERGRSRHRDVGLLTLVVGLIAVGPGAAGRVPETCPGRWSRSCRSRSATRPGPR